MNSKVYVEEMLTSTCCHSEYLVNKDGQKFVGIYNGLSYWGKVYQLPEYILVWQGEAQAYIEDDGSLYQPNFSYKDFERLSNQKYMLMKEIP